MVLNVNVLEAGSMQGKVLFTYGMYAGLVRIPLTVPGMGVFTADNDAANKRIVLRGSVQGIMLIVR